MEPREFERDENRRGPDHLDKWLDAALHEYGSAEPRVGLEGRVLANLAAERARATKRRWWGVGVAAAMACVGVVVWVGGMNHRSSSADTASKTASVEQRAARTSVQSVRRPVVEAVRRPRPRRAKPVEVVAAPRLSQFPSPRPLSEQEQLLVRYVTEAPSEAVLIAKEQADWRREIQESRDSAAETKSGD